MRADAVNARAPCTSVRVFACVCLVQVDVLMRVLKEPYQNLLCLLHHILPHQYFDRVLCPPLFSFFLEQRTYKNFAIPNTIFQEYGVELIFTARPAATWLSEGGSQIKFQVFLGCNTSPV